MILLFLAAAVAQPSPAVLIIKTSSGYQFAQFSSLARCEAARAAILADREAKQQEMEKRGYKLVAPAEFKAVCMPG